MNRAFTLIELLIVIAIIAILALIAIPNFLEAQIRSKVSRFRADMRTMATAIEAYAVDYSTPPLAQGSQDVWRWQMYSHFTWSLRADGSIKDCTFCLTTPVAYIGMFAIDPFIDRTIMTDLAVPRGKNGYYYINVRGGYGAMKKYHPGQWVGAKNITGPAEKFKFDGSDGRVHETTWALMSPGPDMSMRDLGVDGTPTNVSQAMFTNGRWNEIRQGTTPLYDPTNGSASAGNIWRLNGGGP